MKIALLNVINKNKKGALTKDLAGGMGTLSCLGTSLIAKLLTVLKKHFIKIPVISFAYLQAILKEKGHQVEYFESATGVLNKEYDLVLVYGSIVDFRNEIKVCQRIKQNYKNTKVGFFGTLPSIRPDIFNLFDFVLVGEVESFFLYEFRSLDQLQGIVQIEKNADLNDFPTPDFSGFDIKEYSYFPMLAKPPFITLQASRGCPFSCAHYCAYGMYQGPRYRLRSAEKVVRDIELLIDKYNIKSIQFRDPTFGLNKEDLKRFCNLLIDKKINIKFGIETRMDILDTEIIDLLFKAGLRGLNVGVETSDKEVASINKRKLIEESHQEKIIKYCEKKGIKVAAFYIFGLMGDTKESIKKTIDYAVKLNTTMARFGISCPYPGTGYYEHLKAKDMLIEDDLEKYDSFTLVFKHDKLSAKDLEKLMNLALRKYYFRFNYLTKLLKWKIREFWL